MEEQKETMADYIKKISPGNSLRNVIDDLQKAGLGALIVFDSLKFQESNIIESGFKVNCRFTTQKLFELCKMDGAIIISTDLRKILYANTILNPDTTIPSNETGTRHKAAERTAKQTDTFVIAVSERRKKTTLFFSGSRYSLRSSEEVLRNLTSKLQILEKQREILDNLISKLNILEMSELVSVSDVCKTIQRLEMILKISESIKTTFIELGKEGNIMNMRHKELLKDIEKKENAMLRDYSPLPLKKAKTILDNFSIDGLLDLESIARLIIEKKPEENIAPQGYRFFAHLTLTEKEIPQLVKQFGTLNKIFSVDSIEFESLLKNRAEKIKEDVCNLREQILAGKVVC
ncbi:DNA integrity scanning protein DisA [Candidatus Pacearchaeota archaeon]|nr:DNA integrity scanning protein DisA [Candidatus Pacearchaeota archaeon]|tara:strand:- start:5600 stop:6640 length:1041 start_codon:yes stop_codon:yes gene_type:complete